MLNGLPDLPEDQQLDTLEAGEIAHRHRRTIVSWIKHGHLEARQLPGERGQYRILWKDLKRLLEHRYVPTR